MALQQFFGETGFDKDLILPSLKIVSKITENIMNSPMEPKFRTLNTTKKVIQEKLLKWDGIVKFLKGLGF